LSLAVGGHVEVVYYVGDVRNPTAVGTSCCCAPVSSLATGLLGVFSTISHFDFGYKIIGISSTFLLLCLLSLLLLNPWVDHRRLLLRIACASGLHCLQLDVTIFVTSSFLLAI